MTDPKCEFEAVYNEPCANAEITQLRARCDNLRSTRDELVTENDALRQRTRELEAHRDALEIGVRKALAVIRRLEAALKPFADCASWFKPRDKDDKKLYWLDNTVYSEGVHPKHRLTVGDFRTAARALKADDGA